MLIRLYAYRNKTRKSALPTSKRMERILNPMGHFLHSAHWGVWVLVPLMRRVIMVVVVVAWVILNK
jgi:hypothetical protein